MSSKPDTQERVRALARRHPGWTPSQVAIYLQGEGLKITSEDVRRILASPSARSGEEAATAPRYAAPREERRRSALPIGLLMGVLLFVLTAGAGVLLLVGGADPAAGNSITLLLFVLGLLVTGAVASRRWASGARAGMIAGLVLMLLLIGFALGLAAQLYSTLGLAASPAMQTALDDLTQVASGPQLAAAVILPLLFAALLGLVLGWLGAKLFGRRKRRATFG